MKTTLLIAMLLLIAGFARASNVAAQTDSGSAVDSPATEAAATDPAEQVRDLATIIGNIGPVSQELKARRSLAHATFCLPQAVLGTLFYGLLQITGMVVDTASMNEVTIVVTKAPIGASLGALIFLGESVLTENAVRHEYGHTLQGYKRGPFYLLIEGAASFAQAAVSLISPGFQNGYFNRWPEDEASRLGGVR